MNGTKEKLKEKLKGKKGFVKSCLKILFGHGGLFFLVAFYSVLGAFILISIELPGDEYKFSLKKIAGQDLQDSCNYITNYAWYQSSQNLGQQAFVAEMTKKIDLYHKYVVAKYQNNNYDGDIDYWEYSWTFPRALLFTVTTIGTIGYGDITPKMPMGQIFTVYYGMIGVPLLLLFLANIGTFFANSFQYIYSRICCRMCRIRRKYSELRGKQQLKKRVLWSETVGVESYMPTEFVQVPIIMNLVLIFVYLMLGGFLFSAWEGWTMVEAVYFTFITLSTIGFGDYVPGNSFAASSDTPVISALKMLVTILFCLFGMALISMAINLMQEEMVNKVKWIASEMGMAEVDHMPPNKNDIKYSPDGTVHTTPPDKDGNKKYSLLINEDDDLKPKKKIF